MAAWFLWVPVGACYGLLPDRKRVIGFYQTASSYPDLPCDNVKSESLPGSIDVFSLWGLVSLTVTFEQIAFQGGPFPSYRCETHSSRLSWPLLLSHYWPTQHPGQGSDRVPSKGSCRSLPSSLSHPRAWVPTPDFQQLSAFNYPVHLWVMF